MVLGGSSLIMERNSAMSWNVAGLAAAISLRQASNLQINDCEFVKNLATDKVGAILIDQDCTAKIYDSLFKENVGSDAISVLKLNKAKELFIQGCEFIDNVSKSVLFQLQSTESITIKDSTFIGNKASDVTPGIYLLGSTMSAENVTILQNESYLSDYRLLQARQL